MIKDGVYPIWLPDYLRSVREMELQRADIERLYEELAQQPANAMEAQLARRSIFGNRKAMFSGLILLITILSGAVAYFSVNYTQGKLGLSDILCKANCEFHKKLFPIDKVWINKSDVTNILQLNETGRMNVIFN